MDTKTLLSEALLLIPSERLKLIELLAQSLNKPDATMEELWKVEAENRVAGYKSGKITTFTINEIAEKYKRK